MANLVKPEELATYRRTLEALRSRLRGDLDQMTDEALRLTVVNGSDNLSKVPLHMADLGTENYDQEFTLELIENEQGTLDLVNEALARLDEGKFGLCVECSEPIPRPRLQAIPYARHCIRCARMVENGG